MLEQWLGPDVFREGVRAYLAQHEHRSARSSDLFAALSAASGRDVGRVASSFLDQPGVPLVEAELSCEDNGKVRVLLRQSRYRSAQGGAGGRAADPKWLVPVCVAAEGQTSGPTCMLLEGERGSIELPRKTCPRWIYPNAQELGYYRFSLSPEGFRALGDARASLDVASRAFVLEHAWALVQSGRLGADVLVELLSGLRRERHRIVFEQAIAVLRAMADSVVDEETRPAFESFASALLLPRAKELGFGARPSDTDEDRLLRRSLLGALSTVSTDPWLYAEADRLTGRYLRDPTGIDPDIAAIALRISSRRGGQARYQELIRALSAARTPQHRVAALGALSSFADDKLLRSALDLVFDERVKKQDAFYLVSGATAWPQARPLVVAWLEERLPELQKQIPEVMLVRILDSLDTVCDAPSRDRLRGRIKTVLRGVDGAEHRIDQVVERADLCIAQREREGERLRAALQKHRR
jgi:cytosol alanyl aminopeptidase